MNEPYIQALRDFIRQKHGCISRYGQTVPIKEDFKEQMVWDGNVEIFDLAGHATARQCYAWGYKDAEGRRQLVAVLKSPPVDSALKAVQSFIAGRQKA